MERSRKGSCFFDEPWDINQGDINLKLEIESSRKSRNAKYTWQVRQVTSDCNVPPNTAVTKL